MANWDRWPLRIEKIAADSFRFILKPPEAILDGPSLLATLRRQPSLQDSNGQPLSAQSVFESANALEIGQALDLEVVERVE